MVFSPDRPRGPRFRQEDTGGMTERVVFTRRIAKVVKGGRRLRFNALVVVGDGQGQVGVGLGKALVIPDAVRKGNAIARRDMVTIPLKGGTIPQAVTLKKGATIVIIKPAREGTGVIAAGAKEIYVVATHGVLPGDASTRLAEKPYIKEVVITDTVPLQADKVNSKIKVISIAPLLGEAIRRIHEGRSVGELFTLQSG